MFTIAEQIIMDLCLSLDNSHRMTAKPYTRFSGIICQAMALEMLTLAIWKASCLAWLIYIYVCGNIRPNTHTQTYKCTNEYDDKVRLPFRLSYTTLSSSLSKKRHTCARWDRCGCQWHFRFCFLNKNFNVIYLFFSPSQIFKSNCRRRKRFKIN